MSSHPARPRGWLRALVALGSAGPAAAPPEPLAQLLAPGGTCACPEPRAIGSRRGGGRWVGFCREVKRCRGYGAEVSATPRGSDAPTPRGARLGASNAGWD